MQINALFLSYIFLTNIHVDLFSDTLLDLRSPNVLKRDACSFDVESKTCEDFLDIYRWESCQEKIWPTISSIEKKHLS